MSLPWQHRQVMPDQIVLRTFRDHLVHRHGLACWCPGCRRWATCNLGELVMRGLGDREPARCRPRCRICGEEGQWQVRAPVPPTPAGP